MPPAVVCVCPAVHCGRCRVPPAPPPACLPQRARHVRPPCRSTACEGAKKCSSCEPGYVINKAGDKCEACGPSCDACDTPGVCTACASTADTTMVAVNGTCVACPEKCNSCSDPKTCEQCVSGYGLVGGACVACASPACLMCDGDAAKCTKCYPGGADAASGACKNCTVAVSRAGCAARAALGMLAQQRHVA